MLALRHISRRVYGGAGRLAALNARQISTGGFDEVVNGVPVSVFNPSGKDRVVVTKDLPGTRWMEVLTSNGCRVEACPPTVVWCTWVHQVCRDKDTILPNSTIKKLMGDKCEGVLGQLTEDWGDELFGALKAAGGKAFSNYAVGYNNVDVAAGNKHGIPIGNTPGVLTETTAEIALALTFAAGRRVVEADEFMRKGMYKGWLPDLFVGNHLQGATVGIIGAGRIGVAYARMMVEGHKMNVVYYDLYQSNKLEGYVSAYGTFLESQGEPAVTCTRMDSVEDVLKVSDVVSLHCLLDAQSTHLINKERLNLMKKDAILVNAARGPVVDEVALVAHLQANPEFKCGLDVFEDEPLMKPGLEACKNAVIVPHIASAALWTRGAMATLAASNVAGLIRGFPVFDKPEAIVDSFIHADLKDAPKACPSIVNAKDVGM